MGQRPCPNAEFQSPEVFACKAAWPTAELLLPVVSAGNGLGAAATLLAPSVYTPGAQAAPPARKHL